MFGIWGPIFIFKIIPLTKSKMQFLRFLYYYDLSFFVRIERFPFKLDFSVGGIRYPKHFGQSGHPIPLPVIRTIDPAAMTKYTKDKL